ncbi:cupin domain-containing protein [Acetobacter nitrogenifigens]|uniref:Transcription regulator n=1 Tax=Acetobacter nitrogenifigens DSM 23921 = NBRC 105050 TaxID=1120919 RepID=A0A511X8N9_9PROT|nr:cupin domain-containing protein [Acetobacter nitrogenifigens]GEN59291.1 transcription regulator [Acetobacter nitrogenifigens DSM 23921 = NBRC 105050]
MGEGLKKNTSEQKNIPFPVRDDPVVLGGKLRALRQSKGLSIDQVAKAIGVNKSFISKLEHDAVAPSIATLVRYCDAVGAAVGDLFARPAANIIRKADRKPINFGGENLSEFIISGDGQDQVMVLISEIEPGGGSGAEQYTLRSAVDLIHVVSGRLNLTLDDVTYTLDEGDTITFPPTIPHSWVNPSATEPAKAFWVISPPP